MKNELKKVRTSEIQVKTLLLPGFKLESAMCEESMLTTVPLDV